jgi:hypothetical protein
MSSIAYEELQKRIAEKLNVQIKEFHKTIGEISERFRNLGLETAVWYPEKIHAGNLGGIDADSYIGYSRLEGRWGLVIRTIEHDRESHAFAGQKLLAMESCRNMDIVVNALKKIEDLMLCIHKTVEHQIEVLSHHNG